MSYLLKIIPSDQNSLLVKWFLNLPLINLKIMIVFGVVIALFILAIVSVWLFPNKSVSDNEHDIKH
jgi:hypothetical protein